jgi:hypothetical protein
MQTIIRMLDEQLSISALDAFDQSFARVTAPADEKAAALASTRLKIHAGHLTLTHQIGMLALATMASL